MSSSFLPACRLLCLSPENIARPWIVSGEISENVGTGFWTSVSGASAQAQNVDMVANNLANSDTLAFKKDLPTFKEFLKVEEQGAENQEIPRGPLKNKDLFPLDGKDQSFVTLDGTHTNFRQGNLRVTQSPLDIALDGKGFLEISTPFGERLTRQGALKMNSDGLLVTTDGYPVLASRPGGLAAAQGGASSSPNADVSRYINLRDRGARASISINSNGEIYAGSDFIAQLGVLEFNDLEKLHKIGGTLFENKDSGNVSSGPLRTQVRQGVLETSNVNPVEEMSNLIQANRLFEHDLKAMKTYGELMQREANDVGKL